jgi:DNA-binding transcriptional LysR family regulator
LATFPNRKPPSWYSVPFVVVRSKVPPLAIGASNHQLTPLLHWKRNDTGEMFSSATFLAVGAVTWALGIVRFVSPLATFAEAAIAGAAAASMTTRSANSTTTIARLPTQPVRTACGPPMRFLL